MSIMRNLKVGLFFITLGTAGTSYVVLSTDGFNQFNTKSYEVVLDDAMGLSTNSKVYVAGVPVGKIKTIDIVDGQALLEVAFLKNVEIRGDAMISRKSASILGTSILTLTPGTDDMPIVKTGGRIKAEQGASDMSALVDSAQSLSAQISGLLEEFQTKQLQLLTVSLQTFNSMALKMDERSDAELDRITRILESTALITERFEKILGEHETDLGASATDIHFALENIRFITEEVRSGNGNIGKAVNDAQLYDSLLVTAQRAEDAATKLQDALDSVNHLATNADKVVTDAGGFISKINGLGVQVDTQVRYDILSSAFRSGASLRLEPESRDRWYRIGVSSSPGGIASRTVTETATNGAGTVRTDTTETKPGVSFDAELARRIGMVTLRGGLLESTAGIGLDFQPVSWVTVSGEVLDFKTNVPPNLKGAVTLYPFFDPNSNKPWNWIYLRGGVISALDSKRDYFFSGGLRFADEEVRGLVGLVPLVGK